MTGARASLAPHALALVTVLVVGAGVTLARAPLADDLRTLQRIAARPIRASGPVPEGPVALRGRVAARPRVTSPSGASGSAWVAWVGSWVGSGKSRHFDVACELGDLSALVVEVGGESLRFDPAGAALHAATGDTFPLHATGVSLDLDAVTSPAAGAGTELPEHVRAACESRLVGEPLYREAVVAPGAELDVVACRRGERLEPCGDGFDYLTVGSLRQRVDATREERAGGLLVVSVLFAALASAVGYAGARAVVRARREPEEGA